MIYVTPLSHLDDTLRKSRAIHLISLFSPGQELVRPAQIAESGWLALSMNDIVEERDGLIAPSKAHIMAVLDFVDGWNGQGPLVTNCYAGISRSTAVAYIIACILHPKRDELDLAHKLRQLSPSATPNLRLVALADEIVARQGRMVAAIRSIGRGCEAYSGKPFILDLKEL